MEEKKIKIAIVGFGVVGSGVAKILLEKAQYLYHKTGLMIELAHVVDTDTQRPRKVTLPTGILHSDLDKVINDPEVSIVVELIGGTTIAADIQMKLLAAGKHVVTANKSLLAERGQEIFAVARENNRCVAFGASCCGGVPIISAIRTGLAANEIKMIIGIVNGTCNFILSNMDHEGKEYSVALKEAQVAGFAEADPTLDVSGYDSAHKLAIMASLALGKKICIDDVSVEGIDNVNLEDILFGKDMGYAMKLLAIATQSERGLSLRVHPAFIPRTELLAQVTGPFNAVSVFGDAVGHTSYYGRGAGMMATASSVVADIIDVANGNSVTLFDSMPGLGRDTEDAVICPHDEVVSRYYIHVTGENHPGVFAGIVNILAQRKINISSCMQHENGQSDLIPVVITTYEARLGDIEQALSDIEKLDFVHGKPVCIQLITMPSEENC
ncbi:MAG: homoserine dehydrogenase [Phycisphaerae bacterium]|nr:homoserine dehydrogenase [Phycisphaerae bacterium]